MPLGKNSTHTEVWAFKGYYLYANIRVYSGSCKKKKKSNLVVVDSKGTGKFFSPAACRCSAAMKMEIRVYLLE